MFKNSVLAALALVAVCSLSVAQERRGERRRSDDPQGPLTPNRFVLIASGAGMAEVAHGKLATQKAASEDVRKFGQMMVDDHTKANKELAQIAEKKQIPIARDMDRKHQDMQRKLSELTGAAFDREYIAHMVKAHEEAVALFSKFAESGTDPDLKAFARETLPTLKEHLQKVKEIAEKIH